MIGLGAIEVFILLLLGSPTGDLATILDVHDYFQNRKIAVTPSKMLELASAEPSDARQELQQLLALRYFAEHAVEVKQADNIAAILATVEAIAQGKQAQDPLGFAREYAAKASAALGSKTVAARDNPLPKDSVRKDALAWFPKDATLVAAVDFRQLGSSGDGQQALRAMIVKLAPPARRGEIYDEVEKIGNVRLDRYALAYTADPESAGKGRIYMRFSGKASSKRISALLNKPGSEQYVVTTAKTPEGTVITHLQKGKRPPAMAFIGDTEFLVTGYERDTNEHKDLLDTMLAIRAGKTPNVLAGPLASKIGLTSTQANGIFVGDLPENVQRNIGRGLDIATPKGAIAELARKGDGARLDAKLLMANADDAKKLAALLLDSRDRAKPEVTKGEEKQQQIPLPLPKNFFKEVHKMLDSVQAEAKGDLVQASFAADLQTLAYAAIMVVMPAPKPVRPIDPNQPLPKDDVKQKLDPAPKDAPKELPPRRGATSLLHARSLHWTAPALLHQGAELPKL